MGDGGSGDGSGFGNSPFELSLGMGGPSMDEQLKVAQELERSFHLEMDEKGLHKPKIEQGKQDVLEDMDEDKYLKGLPKEEKEALAEQGYKNLLAKKQGVPAEINSVMYDKNSGDMVIEYDGYLCEFLPIDQTLAAHHAKLEAAKLASSAPPAVEPPSAPTLAPIAQPVSEPTQKEPTQTQPSEPPQETPSQEVPKQEATPPTPSVEAPTPSQERPIEQPLEQPLDQGRESVQPPALEPPQSHEELKAYADDRYDHYMGAIQEEMQTLNSERNAPDYYDNTPEADQDALNTRMNELSSERDRLYDIADLPVEEQATRFEELDARQAEYIEQQEQQNQPFDSADHAQSTLAQEQEQRLDAPTIEETAPLNERQERLQADELQESILQNQTLEQEQTLTRETENREGIERNQIIDAEQSVLSERYDSALEAQEATALKSEAETPSLANDLVDNSTTATASATGNDNNNSGLSMDPEYLLAGEGIAPAQELSREEVDRLNQISENAKENDTQPWYRRVHEAGKKPFVELFSFSHVVSQEGAYTLTSAAAFIGKPFYTLGSLVSGDNIDEAIARGEKQAQAMTFTPDAFSQQYEYKNAAMISAGLLLGGGIVGGASRSAAISANTARFNSHISYEAYKVAKVAGGVKLASAGVSATASIAGQKLSDPDKELNYNSILVATVTGYNVPGHGLLGTVGIGTAGVLVDSGLNDKSIGEVRDGIIANAAFTGLGYGVGHQLTSGTKSLFRDAHAYDVMTKQYFQKHTAFDYNPGGNKIPSILGNLGGTALTESSMRLSAPVFDSLRKKESNNEKQ